TLRALGEEALYAAVLQRVEGDSRDHAALAQQSPGERQRAVELVQLVVDRDAQRLKGALGGMAASEASRRGHGRADCLVTLLRSPDRRLRAATPDRAGDRTRVALLAELAQRSSEAALVPLGDDLARAQLLRGIHPHVKGCLVGVRETTLTSVYLHRRHAQV